MHSFKNYCLSIYLQQPAPMHNHLAPDGKDLLSSAETNIAYETELRKGLHGF